MRRREVTPPYGRQGATRRGGYHPPSAERCPGCGRIISAPTIRMDRDCRVALRPTALSPKGTRRLRRRRSQRLWRCQLRQGTPFGCPRGGAKAAAPLFLCFSIRRIEKHHNFQFSILNSQLKYDHCAFRRTGRTIYAKSLSLPSQGVRTMGLRALESSSMTSSVGTARKASSR